jgi:GTP-binding protein HflX
VGFIRHLPHKLVEAFKSTLEEVAEADLLLHIVDGANPERREQMQEVDGVLAEIHAEGIPQIIVYNKIDLTGEPAHMERDASGRAVKVWLSARTGTGMELLKQALSEYYRRHRLCRQLRLPPAAGRLRALIHEHLHVIRESNEDTGDWLMEVELDQANLNWLSQQNDFSPGLLLPETPPTLSATGQ